MNHFLSNFFNYLMVEVIESTWTTFLQKLETVKNMDELIKIHSEFIQQILKNALLNSKDEKLYRQLLKIFDLVFRFELIQQSVLTTAQELSQQFQQMKQELEYKKQIMEDSDSPEEDLDEMEMNINQLSFPKETIEPLKNVWIEYQKAFEQFQKIMNQKQDQKETHDNIRFLNFKLDFNEFYKQKKIK